MRLLRSPLLHFLLLGGTAFLVRQAGSSPLARPEAAPQAIVISAARLREMRASFARDTGTSPTTDDERTLLRREIDTELLYREALALGLDRDDRSIRWQLVEKMSFIEGVEAPPDDEALYRKARDLGLDRDDPVIRRMLVEKMRLLVQAGAARRPIDDATLREHLAAHAERFERPARISFRHAFLSRSQRGDRAEADAQALLVAIRAADASAVDALLAARGDSFPVGTVVRGKSQTQIAAIFGDAFASALAIRKVGEWAVVPSALGVHVVRVDDAVPSATPDLDAVRTRLMAEVIAQRTADDLDRLLATLRQRYAVTVEDPVAAS